MIRFIIAISFVFSLQTKLFSQSNCERFKKNNAVIENMRDSYFADIKDFIILFPNEKAGKFKSSLYSGLNFENCLELDCDSVRLILICSETEENQFEFVFVRLLHFIKIPQEKMQLSFNFNSDFTRIVEFKVQDGLVTEETEMDCEPE